MLKIIFIVPAVISTLSFISSGDLVNTIQFALAQYLAIISILLFFIATKILKNEFPTEEIKINWERQDRNYEAALILNGKCPHQTA